MNIVYRAPFILIRRCASHFQIKYLLKDGKHTKKVYLSTYNSLNHKNYPTHSRSFLANSGELHENCRFLHTDSSNVDSDIDEADDIDELLRYDEMLRPQSTKNLLYANSNDNLMIKLNGCASIEQVLNLIKVYGDKMQHEHTTQAVLVLWDLQKIFFYAHQINKPNSPCQTSDELVEDYVTQLTEHPEFHKLLELVKVNHVDMNADALSCTLLYLNKIGLNVRHNVLQSIVSRLKEALGSDISLSALSRFIVTVCSEQNLGSLFLAQDVMPIVVEKLEKCNTVEDLKLITICLNHLHHIVTDDLLQYYKDKVRKFLDENLVTSENQRTILKVVMFLNYPRWSSRNTALISEMMLMLKDNLHVLGVFDFFIVYEIFYKNHEPGELLTDLQRCASRLLLHLDEEQDLSTDIKTKLLSCIICFSSPRHRSDYESTIAKCVKNPLTKTSIFDLLRILTFVKPESKLCDLLWDNILKNVQTKGALKNSDVLLKLCHKYMNYSSDVHYRYKKFEAQMIEWLREEMERGIIFLIPSKFCLAAAFIFAYSNDRSMIDYTVEKITETWEQLSHVDCLYVAKGLRHITEVTNNPCVTPTHIYTVNRALDRTIGEKLMLMIDSAKVNYLLKSCIYRKRYNSDLIHNLLSTFKPDQELSSMSIRNIMFSLQATNGLLPDVINNIANYVITNRDRMLGFNVEKVAYLCYFLGYSPNKSDELFQAITDVIIRDQERISGLSFIQVALSLCFFNKLPDSFIKQIFNVAFLEKLDAELATCYFKDVYPIRVRHSMMQLNRAVCLDYPQSNIPWFHKKYIEQLQNKAIKERPKETELTFKIKEHLLKIVGNPEYLVENTNTAYGYYVDFLLHLDNNGHFVKPSETQNGTKIAILLLKQNAYTNVNVQLKGQYQLKKRHLEILGYKVLTVNVSEWNSIVYGEEKMEYLNKLIWPGSTITQSYSAVER